MITYRPAIAADRTFVLSGWSSSLRTTRDVPFIAMADWASIMHPVINKVIDRAGACTLVAEASVLAGFICFERSARMVDERRRRGFIVADYVFYVYVARPFREQGVARGLFAAAGIDPVSRFHYACRTLSSFELRGQVPAAQYSPFHARYSPEETQNHERTIVRKIAR